MMILLLLFLPLLSFSKDLFTLYGDVFQVAISAYALIHSYQEKDTEGMKELGISYALSMGATYALKVTVHERRPNGSKHSFPSGHTSSAFAGAWYLQRRYGSSQGIPAVILASFVGASRVHAKAHYVHDVLASVLLTFGISYAVVKRYSVGVEVSEEETGLVITGRW